MTSSDFRQQRRDAAIIAVKNEGECSADTFGENGRLRRVICWLLGDWRTHRQPRLHSVRWHQYERNVLRSADSPAAIVEGRDT